MERLLRRLRGLLLPTLLVPLLAACGGGAVPPASDQPASPAAATTSGAAATSAPAATEPAAADAPAATADPGAAAGSSDGKTLIIGYNQFPDTLYGYASTSSMTSQVLQFIQPGCVTQLDYQFQPVCFEELPSAENGGMISETVTIEPADITPESPVLLDGIIITDGATLDGPVSLPQLTVQWTIKEGIAWEDGTPLTSDDFIFSWRLADAPETPIATRYTLDRTVELTKIDERTFSWTGIPGHVDPVYYTNFTGTQESSFAVYPAHILQDIPPGEMVDSEFASRPIGYGPFMVEEYTPQESITLVKNPRYWGAAEGLPKVERVIIKFLSDEDQVLAQLESGDIDVAGTIGLTLNSADTLDALVADGTLGGVQYVPSATWEHIDFGIERADGQPSFFEDVRVRQAVAYGVDRAQIVEQVLGGRTVVMDSYQPPDYWAYPEEGELNPYAYDPEQAKTLLDEAGWAVGANGIREKDGRPFSVQFYTTEGNRTREQVAQIIQANLKEIGIDLQLEFVPGTEVLFKNGEDGILYGRRFDMALYAWTAGPEPSANLYFCNEAPGPENNFTGQNSPAYCNEEFERYGQQVFGRLTREERTPPIVETLKIFNRDLPALPLYQRVQITAWRPGVSGVNYNASSFVDFHQPELLDIAAE